MIKSFLTFILLVIVNVSARVFFKLKNDWITPEPANYAKGTRIIAILNHTSLYEPLIAGYAPYNLLWKFARHGVLPVAEKTMKRRIGLFFSFLVRHPVVVTRQRDHTWDEVLNRIDSKAIVIILPEGPHEASRRPRLQRPRDDGSRGHRRHARCPAGRPHADGVLRWAPPYPGARRAPADALQDHQVSGWR